MPTNLTGSTIASTYNQLLHVDGGPTPTEKTVYSGDGVATALKVGTGSVSVDNIRLDGNTISSTNTNGDLVLVSNGTGVVDISNANISNANISNANISSLLTGGSSAGINFNNTTLTAVGTNDDIDINITPKGSGRTKITNLDMLGNSTIPFSAIQGRSYAVFLSTVSQSGSTSQGTPVRFDATPQFATPDITLTSDGTNLTRIVFATTGIYRITSSFYIYASGGSNDYFTVWFSINNNPISASSFRTVIGGGTAFNLHVTFYISIMAGQYLQMFWAPFSYTSTFLYFNAASSFYPAIPSVYTTIERIA